MKGKGWDKDIPKKKKGKEKNGEEKNVWESTSRRLTELKSSSGN